MIEFSLELIACFLLWIFFLMTIEYFIGFSFQQLFKRLLFLKESNKEIESYRQLVNLIYCFIDLKPEHPLYNSLKKDIKSCLGKLKNE